MNINQIDDAINYSIEKDFGGDNDIFTIGKFDKNDDQLFRDFYLAEMVYIERYNYDCRDFCGEDSEELVKLANALEKAGVELDFLPTTNGGKIVIKVD